jgi:Tfp pilus assembly protein PilF
MTNDAVKEEQDESIGHYADRELSYAYLFTGDYDNALAHALKEYNRRPQNIDVNETVAWVYHKQGKNEEALPYIKAALNTNSKNPTLLCRAGLIFVGCGNKTGAKTILQQALQMNPNIDVELKKESDEVLKLI